MVRTYSVFISHSWSHISDLENLRNSFKERGYFNVEFEESTPDDPINSENTAYVKRRLKQKIQNSDIVLGIAGVYALASDWIEWELDTAIDNDIPIIGVIPRGQTRISQIVSSRSKVDVNWNTESIVEAIRNWAK